MNTDELYERTERKRFRRIAARKAIFDRIRFCTENGKPERVCVYMCMCDSLRATDTQKIACQLGVHELFM